VDVAGVVPGEQMTLTLRTMPRNIVMRRDVSSKMDLGMMRI